MAQLLGPPLAAYAMVLTVEWFARAGSQPLLSPAPQADVFFRDLFAWPTAAPFTFVINYCLALGLTWLGASIFGRTRWGVAAMGVLLLALAAINRTKLIYTDTPISPRDLAVAWFGAKFILHSMPGWIWPVALAAVVGLWFGLRWLRRHIRTAGLSASSRVLLACAAVVLLGGSVAIIASPLRDAINLGDTSTQQSRHGPGASAYYQGFALNLTTHIAVPVPDPPAGYNPKRLGAICERFAARTPASTAPSPASAPAPLPPSIILWLSESFWDIGAIPSITATPDPLANYRRLAREGRAAHLLVPGYGGPTSATMYEVLTGMSHKFVPEGVDEYANVIERPIPSVAWLMRTRGYHTLAIHADWGKCFRSPTVYPLLGFERYEYEVDFPEAPRRGLFVSDEFLTDYVIRKIESSDRPMLIFAASMQAHGPYTPDTYRHVDVQIHGGIPELARLQFRTFAQHMREADAALARLTDHFRRSRRPVILAFFGDHLPPLGSTYQQVGFIDIGRDTALPQRLVQHTTPALLWTNTALPLPEFATPVSAPQLTMHITRMAGVQHPFYTGVLGEVGRAYPGLSPRVCVRHDGQLVPPEVNDPAVQDYELLCYDSLFGQHFCWPQLFPEVPPR